MIDLSSRDVPSCIFVEGDDVEDSEGLRILKSCFEDYKAENSKMCEYIKLEDLQGKTPLDKSAIYVCHPFSGNVLYLLSRCKAPRPEPALQKFKWWPELII